MCIRDRFTPPCPKIYPKATATAVVSVSNSPRRYPTMYPVRMPLGSVGTAHLSVTWYDPRPITRRDCTRPGTTIMSLSSKCKKKLPKTSCSRNVGTIIARILPSYNIVSPSKMQRKVKRIQFYEELLLHPSVNFCNCQTYGYVPSRTALLPSD